MSAKVIAELRGIDILVNNAGNNGGEAAPVTALPEEPGPELAIGYRNPRDHSASISDEVWHRVMNTNVGGTFYTCRAIGTQMMERRYGKVINIASINSIMAYPYNAPYQSSKAAVKMFTKVLAMEWAQFNINVNCIMPGWFITEMTRRSFENPDIRREREEGLPLKRVTSNRDLGPLALYLASPASDWMTAQAIALDGGMTALYN